MRILICEDNLVIAMDLEMIIEDMGHECVGLVTSATDCLAACRSRPPDLVLVDIDLSDGPTGAGLTLTLDDLGIASVIVSGQIDTLGPSDHAARAVLGKPVEETMLRAAIDATGL